MSTYSAEAHQIEIQAANGGYIVRAWARKGDEFDWETSLFTDINTMVRYLLRVFVDLEGPAVGEFGVRLGNLKLPD